MQLYFSSSVGETDSGQVGIGPDDGIGQLQESLETCSNNNEQIESNIEKRLDLQADARFVCADQRIYHRVVQVACQYAFTENRAFPLKICLYEAVVDGEDSDVYDLDPPRKPLLRDNWETA